MADSFRVATRVPWDADFSPDWGRVLTEAQARNEVMDRAKRHKGKGYKLRERGEDWFGQTRTLAMLEKRINGRLNKQFNVGDVLIVWALEDNVQWLIRKVHVRPDVVNIPGGNDGIDINHAIIFGSGNKFPSAESWGILNKRYIGGTTTWSQHAPWRQDNCTSNAEDFHAPTIDAMRKICDECVREGKVAKMLLAGSEWLPGKGWFFVGSYIGHYDHAHIEPFPTRTTVC